MLKPGLAILIALAGIFIIAFLIASLNEAHQYGGWLLMGFFVSLALVFRSYELLKG
jgi:BASS family bile acid:Na+ symporter